MQAPASRRVKAFQNSGVQADSFRPCLSATTGRHRREMDIAADLLARYPDKVTLRPRSGDRGLGERQNKNVFGLDTLFLDT